jgi:hypothetical protein
MIVTEFYDGQGLGNQLWCYVTTRIIAKKKGYEFGIKSPEKFKGNDFIFLDFGKQVFGGDGPEGGPPQSLPQGITHYYREHTVLHPDGSDIRMRDEKLVNVPDHSKIDGLMQDGDFIAEYKNEIKEWLKVREQFECNDYASDDICVINFRGGGYTRDKKFFLPKSYWQHAIARMKRINPNFRFIVITDDVKTGKKFFPEFDVFHFSIAKDYVVIKNAHYLILSNSSFAQFPALLSDNLKYCIAPKYWSRHNTSDGYWSLGYNLTQGWHYIDRQGNIFDSETCRKEWDEYIKKHKDSFIVESPFDPHAPYIAKEMSSTKPLPSFKDKYIWKAKVAVRMTQNKLRSLTPIQFIRDMIREYNAKKTWLTPQEIAEYRKKIKIYDVFTFFNELDLLEIRLNILGPYVDYFVIVEAPVTFSGDKKPLYYQENKERYKQWHHKIIYYVVENIPNNEDDLRYRLHNDPTLSDFDRQTIIYSLTSKNIGKDLFHWRREFYIKEHAKKPLINLNDNDICFISDLDEIWNPELVIDYSKDDIFKPRQIPYVYFLNNRSNESWYGWTGTIVTKYKNLRHESINHIRTHRIMKNKYLFLKNGGWHFTFQGGYEGALRKLQESNHPFYKPDQTIPNLKKMIAQNRDYQGRKIQLKIDERGLPKHLLENKEKYKKFFK